MLKKILFSALMLLSSHLQAGTLPWQFENQTRYMALGDSIAAGYGAVPSTRGYVYDLYLSGAFGKQNNVILSNAAVPSVLSGDVYAYQVPQAVKAFKPDVITLSVGGNDVLQVLNGAHPLFILYRFEMNLGLILQQLRDELPGTEIYISNLYSIPEIPGSDEIIMAFNQTVSDVASVYGVPVADVYSEFKGQEGPGLLLFYRTDAGIEVHPSNAGHQAIADAFRDIIAN